MVEFTETVEKRNRQPLNRFIDLSALDAVDLNFEFVFHVALGRRLGRAQACSEIRLLRHQPRHHPLCQAARYANGLFAAPCRLVHGSRRRGEVARRSARGVIRMSSGFLRRKFIRSA